MSLNLIFCISDFYNLKIVNNEFFFIFEGGLIFLSRAVYINVISNKKVKPHTHTYIYIYIYICEKVSSDDYGFYLIENIKTISNETKEGR